MLRNPAWRSGVLEALASPILVLGLGYLGYGSVAQSQGFGLWQTILSTATIWALPGQLILMEMSALGAPVIAILLAVALSATRFLPMTVSLLPHLRSPGMARWQEYVAAQLLAMTTWAVTMRRYPDLAQRDRLPYFMGFSLTMWGASMAFTAAGYLLATRMPAELKLAFVFANPVYFLLILTIDLRTRIAALGLACGAIAGPLVHLVTPEWSVVGAGLIGGTVAFGLLRRTGSAR